MSWFSRKDKDEAGSTKADSPLDPTDEDAFDRESGDDDSGVEVEDREIPGPRDASQIEDVASYFDFGSILVAPILGMQIRLEIENESQQPVALSMTLDDSTLEVQAFASPRSEGLWDEVRAGLAADARKRGGSAEDVPGRYGRELLARLPQRTGDGRTAHRPVRFVGIDGPRWLVRAAFSGPAAIDVEAAKALEDTFEALVVNRGSEPMAPRDPLPLKVPQAEEQDAAQGAEQKKSDLSLSERGPEISEVR